MNFKDLFQAELVALEAHIAEYFKALPREDVAGLRKLLESMEYSTLDGGKRFRPVLVLATLEALDHDRAQGLPLALAIELIHTYSLIHDDLPLMDNDDTRRGRPTNHKVFGDAMALLAGDALLTEAFTILAEGYAEDPRTAVEIIALVGRAAGLRGMVGGQAIDILPTAGKHEEWEIQYLHSLKTGALIRVAIDGASCLANVPQETRSNLDQFGKSLGLAFQIADDIQDYNPAKQEATSFINALGIDGTKALLDKVTSQALAALAAVDLQESKLAQLCRFNLERVHAE